jgi:predicted nucleic acid-binding protein
VLDACALLAYLYDENGADFMQSIFESAKKNNVSIFMNAVNLLEVYYDILKTHGEHTAKETLNSIIHFPISVTYKIDEIIIEEAGKLKSKYRISLADSIGLAQSIVFNAHFVSADHHELDIVEANETIQFTWFR